MSGLIDSEIKKGMIVLVDHVGSTGLDPEYHKYLLSRHMKIVDFHYCPSCKLNHYRAQFINHTSPGKLFQNYTVNAYQLLKANSE